jgi:hypothetical protein
LQKGRSRTWLSDRVWHVIVVEFQPSAWSRGTYLNVGVTWLWDVKDYWSNDYGPHRVGGFATVDGGDWPDKCRAVAATAAAEVDKLRRDLPDLATVSERLATDSAPGWWPLLHAAIASGLIGDVDRAQALIDRILAVPAVVDGQRTMQTRAADIRSAVADPSAFRERFIGEIQRSREAHKLPPRTMPEIKASLTARGDIGGH